MGKLGNQEIRNNERFFEEKKTNLKYRNRYILSMEGITRENHIQILTQIPFFMLVLGRVMLDSSQSQSST